MKINKAHIIIGTTAIVTTVVGMLLYNEYRKIMNYCIGLKTIKINRINADIADINLFLNFTNKSNIKIEIVSQEYNVYLNNALITKAVNNATQKINAESTSIIGVNVKFNPTSAGLNILNTILNVGTFAIKIDIKLKVKLWFFTIDIPYVYTTTLKELMTPSTQPKTKTTCP